MTPAKTLPLPKPLAPMSPSNHKKGRASPARPPEGVIEMHIKLLTIENFQSHQKTAIEPAPPGQLTVIVGPSDSGKTAIIRALRWLYYNVPQGTNFIRVGCSFSCVTLTLEDGTKVIRERTKSRNTYSIVSPVSKEPQVFAGFGNTPPLEIQETTGVRPTRIGDLELTLNLSEQLDAPFLGKSISAGARAKVLGKLAGTEEVDYAAKQLATDLYRRGQDEKRLTAEIATLDEQMKQYDYLPALAARIGALEQIVAGIKAAQERRRQLAEKKEALRQVTAGITAARLTIQRWQYLDLAEYALAMAEKAQAQKKLLHQLAGKLQLVTREIWQAENTIARLAGLELAGEIAQQMEAEIVRLYKIASYNTSLAGIEHTLRLARKTIEKHARLSEVEKITEQVTTAIERRATLARIGALYRQAEAARNQAATAVRRLAGVNEAEELLARAQNAHGRREKIAELVGRLRQAETEEKKAKEAVVLWGQQIVNLEAAYQEQLIKVGKCPLCGGDIDPERLREAV